MFGVRSTFGPGRQYLSSRIGEACIIVSSYGFFIRVWPFVAPNDSFKNIGHQDGLEAEQHDNDVVIVDCGAVQGPRRPRLVICSMMMLTIRGEREHVTGSPGATGPITSVQSGAKFSTCTAHLVYC